MNGGAATPTPAESNASWIAIASAGIAPTAPASPQPFTPSGLVVQGISLSLNEIGGKSEARGIR